MPEYIVRYGAMRFLGVFRVPDGQSLGRGTAVIVRTDRGLETGLVLCEASPEARAQLKNPVEGPVLRPMSAEDHLEERRLREQADRELELCARHVARLGLDMKLVMVEHIFGGERIVVYYLAENRVDFRELVRALAAEFQTRIEMRQIGVRDEAKLLGTYSDCGLPLCCNTHLVQMPPVSMKMAKLQKATLDPTKISGRCGRLKCCLRYEFEVYEELHKEAARQAREAAKAAAGEKSAQQTSPQTAAPAGADRTSPGSSEPRNGQQRHAARPERRGRDKQPAPPQREARHESPAADMTVPEAVEGPQTDETAAADPPGEEGNP